MRSATMSIMGLYNWDNTLFDLLTVPEGMDKDTLVTMLLAECSGLEILYPNPTVMKNLIGVWSHSSQYSWQTLFATTQFEYNPIDNYDRTETRTSNSQAAGSSADGGTDTNTSVDTGTDRTTNDTTRTGQIAGFESSGASPFTDKEKETIDNDGSVIYGKTNTNTTNYGHTNSNTYSKNDSETVRAHGNIGVTTTQQMIEQERETGKFNIYDVIVEDFKQRYCILVY